MQYEYQESLLPGARLIYVNSSSLKLGSCERNYVWTISGISPPDEDPENILRTGQALHKFAEMFVKNGGDIAEAVREAAKQYPDIPRSTLITCGATRPRVFIPPPIMIKGAPAVEFTFSIPWYSFIHAGQLYQLVLCGTMDHISFDRDRLLIYDYKSSRYRSSDFALKKYEHSSQFAFYQWILYEFAARLGLDLMYANAIREGRLGSHVVPILITAKEPLWVIGPLRALSAEQFASYKQNLVTVLTRDLIPAFLAWTTEQQMPVASGMINGSCQYCKFTKVCYACNNTVGLDTLTAFPIKEHNPTVRD